MIQIADAAEIARLEDALLRFSAHRQWEIKTVAFPATANTDLDIAHSLSPSNPELVNYMVLQAAQPVIVSHDLSATRTPWSSGVIRLRANVASAKVTLLLTVADSNVNQSALTPGSTAGMRMVERLVVELPSAAAPNSGLEARLQLGGFAPTTAISLSGAATIAPTRNVVHIDSAAFTPSIAGITPPDILGDPLSVGEVFIHNDSGTSFTINHESGSASGATYRILCPGGVDYLVPDQTNVHLLYDYEDDRWRIIAGAQQAWVTYTPTWASASNPQPAIGNGTLTGQYMRVGEIVHFRLRLTAGSTTTFGTGLWSFTTPTTMANTDFVAFPARMLEAGVDHYVASCFAGSTTTFHVVGDSDNTAGASGVTPSTPFTWGTDDVLVVNGFYEQA